MTAKEFLSDKTLTGVEIVSQRILNLVVGETSYGLDIDTSDIPAGTMLIKSEDFDITNDILTSEALTVNLATTNMLRDKKAQSEE